MKNVVFLSHTDIRYDSRILKEMTELSKSDDNYQLFGIGVKMDEGSAMSAQASDLEIYSINLSARKLTFFPKFMRHTLTIIEMILKTFFKVMSFKPDIIHCHDTVVLPFGVLLKYFKQSKLIYDAHELESNRNGLSRTMSKLTFYAEKICWPFIDLLITVSPSIEQWYQDNIGPKISEVILNSPMLYANDSKNTSFNEKYFRERYNIPEKTKIYIYVGILGKGRGIEKILNVFSKADCESHVVFMGYGELSDSIRKRESKFKNIHYHKAIQHENIVQVIQSANIGLCLIENVSLSDYYCLPNKLFEYCFAGLPVLASNFPDISTVVKKYGLGICCDLDTDSIDNAIRSLDIKEDIDHIKVNKLYDLSWDAQKLKLLKSYQYLYEQKSVL